jgi:chemotaxis protein CheY-P-specific phosphatase CheC
VTGVVHLGEGRRHKLYEVIVDLDVVADEREEKSSESRLAEVMANMKAHFLTSWARLPGRHILTDVLSPRLELVNVLLGSAMQGRERSLACGIDLVSEGVGGFRASRGG